ncbi:spore coat polysaccharide biosynthesis protein [Bacillus phage vB_BanH_McCartney]|nr:spore coat polysaccharide biosynthesis protein [Bacillus phage vB_BanH_McCartney]
MSKPTLEFVRRSDGGLRVYYTTGSGVCASTYFPAPPESIDHVDFKYLQQRFFNIRTAIQVTFIKKEYKRLYKLYFEGEN